MYPRGFPLVLLAASASAWAQPSESTEEIVVTGQGLAAARGDDVYDRLTIDRERLAASPSNRLEDVLRDVPGFQQFRRSDARSANPTSQGATLRALGGNASSRALLLLDGVPQSDPFGGWIAWPSFDPRRLAEIRVTRGGGTGVHGPGALAGTIELSSAGPDLLDAASASFAYGSRDSIDGFAGAALPLGAGFVTLSGAFLQGDGFVPVITAQRGTVDRPSEYAQGSVALRGVARIGSAMELQARLGAFADERERGVPMSDIRTRGADASLRLIGRGSLPFSALVYVQARHFSNLFASASDDRSEVVQVLDQHSVPSAGLGARVEARPTFGPIELRIGSDWRETEGHTNELSRFVAGAPTQGRTAGGRTRTAGTYVEASWTDGALTATAGGRIDRWWIEDGLLRERTLADGTILTDMSFPDRSGWEPTGRAGLAWRADERLTLRGAAYTGWRLPTLNELYRPFRIGADATAANAALAPERLEGVEAGIDLRPTASARIGVTLFANRLEGAIANVTLAQGPGLFPGVGFVSAAGQFRQRRNLGAVTSRGVELDASLALGHWRLTGGYSFADAEVEADDAARPLDGLRPAQAPRHSAAATLSWSGGERAYAAVTVRHVGGQYEDDLNQVRLPAATTLDAIARVPLSPSLEIEARGENLADARVVTGISGDGIIERATPRTLWLGLRWRH